MKKASLQLETLACPTCAQMVENATKALDGIVKDSVQVKFNASKVSFEYDETKVSLDDVEKAIGELGYGVLK